MYAILVMQLHYPPQYVLDEMQMYEAQVAMKYGYYANKDLWEANRLTAYITAQVNSRKKLNVTDLVTFPWEEDVNTTETKISKEDIERLQKQAEKLCTIDNFASVVCKVYMLYTNQLNLHTIISFLDHS